MCKRPGFLRQRLRDFVKMTLTRVIDMTRIESSHSVKNVTRLDSSQHFFNLTRVESESPKIVIRVESLTRVTLSLVESNACSACPFPNFSQCCKVLYMSTNLCNEWDRIVCISFVVGFVPDNAEIINCEIFVRPWKSNLDSKMQHSTTAQAKQKIWANLAKLDHDHHWSKKWSFLCVKTSWVCPSGAQRFCKNDSDSSLESLIVTRFESSHQKSWHKSRYHCFVAGWAPLDSKLIAILYQK